MLGVDDRDKVTWDKVAVEYQTFIINAPRMVRYGISPTGGSYAQKTIQPGSYVCNNAFFGWDPAPGYVKNCYVYQPVVSLTSNQSGPIYDEINCTLLVEQITESDWDLFIKSSATCNRFAEIYVSARVVSNGIAKSNSYREILDNYTYTIAGPVKPKFYKCTTHAASLPYKFSTNGEGGGYVIYRSVTFNFIYQYATTYDEVKRTNCLAG